MEAVFGVIALIIQLFNLIEVITRIFGLWFGTENGEG